MTTSPPRHRGLRVRSRQARAELEELRLVNARLSGELRVARAERDSLVATKGVLAQRVKALEDEVAILRARLDEARRAGKRQAAPFSKGTPTPEDKRKKPGRRPGSDYGTKARRDPPTEADEDVEVALPECCPGCGGDLVLDRWAEQFQDELVTAIVRRRFHIALGRCPNCQRSVRDRHPEQTSDALGAAGTMLGPRALALAAWLRVGCGLPASKVAALFAELGLSVTPGGIAQAVARLAGDAEGAYGALIAALRASPVVSPDETGWRVDGEKGWLWAYVGDKVTVYDIVPGRGYDEAKAILGEDYDGVLCRDGWASYRSFTNAGQQTCLAHLLRRCHEMIAESVAGQARIPRGVRSILLDALALRERRDAGEVEGQELNGHVADLEARVDKLLGARPTHEPNRKLLKHLGKEREALFTFLRAEGIPATNHQAERAIRPQVVNRKNWGGNKSWSGARTTAVLGSVARTASQQGLDPIGVLIQIATSEGARCGLSLSGGPAP